MIKNILLSALAGLAMLCVAATPRSEQTNLKHRPYLADTTKRMNAVSLKKGDKVPDIVFKDTAGKEVKLSQFKGKYVYIDVWASWCYPCRQEYPKLAALRDRMKDKNIVFVGISCDEKNMRWRSSMYIEKWTGIQWIITNEQFMSLFVIASVPRYILLDKKGVVVNPKMTRPSDPETEKALNALKNI